MHGASAADIWFIQHLISQINAFNEYGLVLVVIIQNRMDCFISWSLDSQCGARCFCVDDELKLVVLFIGSKRARLSLLTVKWYLLSITFSFDIYYTVQGGYNFWVCRWNPSVTNTGIEQLFHVLLFIMPYKVIRLTFSTKRCGRSS